MRVVGMDCAWPSRAVVPRWLLAPVEVFWREGGAGGGGNGRRNCKVAATCGAGDPVLGALVPVLKSSMTIENHGAGAAGGKADWQRQAARRGNNSRSSLLSTVAVEVNTVEEDWTALEVESRIEIIWPGQARLRQRAWFPGGEAVHSESEPREVGQDVVLLSTVDGKSVILADASDVYRKEERGRFLDCWPRVGSEAGWAGGGGTKRGESSRQGGDKRRGGGVVGLVPGGAPVARLVSRHGWGEHFRRSLPHQSLPRTWQRYFFTLDHEAGREQQRQGCEHSCLPASEDASLTRGQEGVHLDTSPEGRVTGLARTSSDGKLVAGVRQAGVWLAGVWQAGVKQVGVWQAGVAGIKQAGVRQAGVRQTGVWQAGVKQAGVRQAGVWQAGVAGGRVAGGVKQAGVWQAGVWQADVWQAGVWQAGIKQVGVAGGRAAGGRACGSSCAQCKLRNSGQGTPGQEVVARGSRLRWRAQAALLCTRPCSAHLRRAEGSWLGVNELRLSNLAQGLA
ncbi:hypothetical protein CYMTET_50347 [Cymbomonas tetramitiformis]|uniref:Uncharacterized protein n=1 Tax=Cymbomonas tetramitiformis TaxID=36881 RepID=A0AAE0BPG3_9CHLO|nr:hypothetical protein CYMTET_50347 [Cymbomonas tetramitiformis]